MEYDDELSTYEDGKAYLSLMDASSNASSNNSNRSFKKLIELSTTEEDEGDQMDSYFEDSSESDKRLNLPFCRKTKKFACKSRGIKAYHTPTNAVIRVPKGAQHGHLVKCSHPECAATRTFRYCAVCEVPATTRNFVKRHSHGFDVPVLQSKQKDAKDLPQQTKLLAQAARPRQHKSNKKARITPPTADNDKSGTEPMSDHQSLFSQLSPAAKDSAVPLVSSDTSLPQAAHQVSLSLEERTWLSLLRERPPTTDMNGLTGWVSKVMKFSSTYATPDRATSSQDDLVTNYLQDWNANDLDNIFD